MAKNLFKMRPSEIMADYEGGLRAAIRMCWPNVSLYGCWFHYCKAINKRCRKLNMTKFLRNNSNAKRVQKALMSLPLLPADQIIEGYECIKKKARRKKLVRSFISLFKYFESYWLKQVRHSYRFTDLLSGFLVLIWLHYLIIEWQKFNIYCWIKNANDIFAGGNQFCDSKIFPGQTNIFEFIECLKLYESWKSDDLTFNRQLKRKRAVDEEREHKIQYFTTQLKNGEISVSRINVRKGRSLTHW